MFGLTFRKEFGQNFLTDREVVAEIAESCGGPNTKTVLEIGAGCGSLTHELALIYENVVALEIDRGLIPLLKYTLGEHRNIKVINADVMKTDIPELLGDAFEKGGVSVCANLPYYITTPILLELLDSRLPFDSITVMIQSEVADRLCALPGTPNYGSVTAYLNYFGTCRKLMRFPRASSCLPPRSILPLYALIFTATVPASPRTRRYSSARCARLSSREERLFQTRFPRASARSPRLRSPTRSFPADLMQISAARDCRSPNSALFRTSFMSLSKANDLW